jgi:hypothetical protein
VLKDGKFARSEEAGAGWGWGEVVTWEKARRQETGGGPRLYKLFQVTGGESRVATGEEEAGGLEGQVGSRQRTGKGRANCTEIVRG